MKSLGLFSQIVIVGLAITIGYFYVQPTVTEIGDTQTEIARYEEERKKIETINSQLSTQLSTLDSIPPSFKERLATYMPRTIDEISVMRDISFIVERANITNTVLAYNGPLENRNALFSQNDEASPSLGAQAATPHGFTVDVQGTYDEIKDFLRLLELNEYPLEIHQLSLSSNNSLAANSVSTQEGDNVQMVASMTLVTYADDLALINGN